MRQEILEIPDTVQRLLDSAGPDVRSVAGHIRNADLHYLLSVARGSSDHACTYLKYVSELILARPMASVGPSVKSIYDVDLNCEGTLCLCVSQSGMSPDIVAMTDAIKYGGGFTVALTNNPESDLARIASKTIPLYAGPEQSVAATKSFVASMIAGLWLIAEIAEDRDLIDAIHTLPEKLAAAIQCDWSGLDPTAIRQSLYTLGRGPCWAIANEAALKFKETCQIHAESYSSAELLHGPVTIIEEGFPVICFAAGDAAEQSIADVADNLTNKGASVYITSNLTSGATVLPHVRTDHWLTDPISNIVSFYCMVDEIANAYGIDPDKPRYLNKITETL
jgi:glucosamine--fructose-6-phosphate aminotransferase (isomerizing)